MGGFERWKRGSLGRLLVAAVLFPGAVASAQTLMVEGEYIVERDPARAALRTSPGSHLPSTMAERRVVGRAVVVGSKESISPNEQSASGSRVVAYDPAFDRCDELRSLDSTITKCGPNLIRHIMATPNDLFYSYQWGHQSAAMFGIDSALAWNSVHGSADVVIGIIDTGVDYYHEDLAGNMWVNPHEVAGNNIDDDNNGYVDDIHGINATLGVGESIATGEHGSHVAGIVGAVGNNGKGVTGVNWNVRMVSVNVDAGEGLSLSSIIAGIDYLISLKAAGVPVVVANASYGGPDLVEPELSAYTRLEQAGIILAAAAGNETTNNDVSPSYPCNLPLSNVICVGAINRIGVLAYFSNYGAQSVHLAAPGEEILSTVPGGGYDVYPGTSMATPFVTGAIGLLFSVRSDLSVSKIRELIMSTGTPLSSLTAKTISGRTLNMNNLLQAAMVVPTPPPPASPTPTGSSNVYRFGEVSGKKLGANGLDARKMVSIGMERVGTTASSDIISFRFLINGKACASLQRVSPVANQFALKASFSRVKGKASAVVQLLGASGEIIDQRKFTVYETKRSKIVSKKVGRTASYVNKVCAGIAQSASF